MKSVSADNSKTIYDDITDVMYVGLGESKFTDEEEVAPGIHVLYAFDEGRTDRVVGVEIEYFKERFGDNPGHITIPVDHPFSVFFEN